MDIKFERCFVFAVCPDCPRISYPKIPNFYFLKIFNRIKSFIPRSATKMRTKMMTMVTVMKATTMLIIPTLFHQCQAPCHAPMLDTVRITITMVIVL